MRGCTNAPRPEPYCRVWLSHDLEGLSLFQDQVGELVDDGGTITMLGGLTLTVACALTLTRLLGGVPPSSKPDTRSSSTESVSGIGHTAWWEEKERTRNRGQTLILILIDGRRRDRAWGSP